MSKPTDFNHRVVSHFFEKIKRNLGKSWMEYPKNPVLGILFSLKYKRLFDLFLRFRSTEEEGRDAIAIILYDSTGEHEPKAFIHYRNYFMPYDVTMRFRGHTLSRLFAVMKPNVAANIVEEGIKERFGENSSVFLIDRRIMKEIGKLVMEHRNDTTVEFFNRALSTALKIYKKGYLRIPKGIGGIWLKIARYVPTGIATFFARHYFGVGELRKEPIIMPKPKEKVKLSIYFHSNIQYAEFPPEESEKIIEQVYEPLVKLTEKHLLSKFNFGWTGFTLQEIKKRKPALFKRIKQGVMREQHTFLLLPYTHPIMPLIPKEDAEKQIKKSEEVYNIVGAKPCAIVLPEMAWSKGIADTIKRNGYDWTVLFDSEIKRFFEDIDITKPIELVGQDTNINAYLIDTRLSALIFWSGVDAEAIAELLDIYSERYGKGCILIGSDTESFNLRGAHDIKWLDEFITLCKSKGIEFVSFEEVKNLKPKRKVDIEVVTDSFLHGAEIWSAKEEDRELNTLSHRAWLHLASVNNLISIAEKYGIDAKKERRKAEKIEEDLLLSENSDGRGWVPVPERVEFARKHGEKVIEVAKDIEDTLLTRVVQKGLSKSSWVEPKLKYRIPVVLWEPYGIKREMLPIRINLKFLKDTCMKNSIRVYDGDREIPFDIYADGSGFIRNAEIVFAINLEPFEMKRVHIYFAPVEHSEIDYRKDVKIQNNKIVSEDLKVEIDPEHGCLVNSLQYKDTELLARKDFMNGAYLYVEELENWFFDGLREGKIVESKEGAVCSYMNLQCDIAPGISKNCELRYYPSNRFLECLVDFNFDRRFTVDHDFLIGMTNIEEAKYLRYEIPGGRTAKKEIEKGVRKILTTGDFLDVYGQYGIAVVSKGYVNRFENFYMVSFEEKVRYGIAVAMPDGAVNINEVETLSNFTRAGVYDGKYRYEYAFYPHTEDEAILDKIKAYTTPLIVKKFNTEER